MRFSQSYCRRVRCAHSARPYSLPSCPSRRSMPGCALPLPNSLSTASTPPAEQKRKVSRSFRSLKPDVGASIAPPYWNDVNVNSSRWKRHSGRPEGLYQNHARRFFDCALMGNGDRVLLIEHGDSDWSNRCPWIVGAAVTRRRTQFVCIPIPN